MIVDNAPAAAAGGRFSTAFGGADAMAEILFSKAPPAEIQGGAPIVEPAATPGQNLLGTPQSS